MPEKLSPDVVVYVCTNCVPQGAHLPRQWQQDGAHILVREVPCSGKMDMQYLMHSLEDGGRGCCVVACPKGDCHLAQGNYRAEMRVHTLQRLLGEIGLEPERVELIHISLADSTVQMEQSVRNAVQRICMAGASPLQSTG
jgi:F420-non-reducing hydrogenase iron-sulfur subunit